MSKDILWEKTWENVDIVQDMISKHIEESWCTLLTVNFAVGKCGQDENWNYLPGKSVLFPKFTAATTYELIMFREHFNIFIDWLINESLAINNPLQDDW